MSEKPPKHSTQDILRQTEKILTSAFSYRMVADVPVGVFLSGGYDSSLVASLLQKDQTKPLKTFTIGFENERYNEANHAKLVAKHLGTEHHEEYCTEQEAKEIIPKLCDIYDEPFGDQSAIPTYLVSKIASQSVKVVLSADGGDEQFVGYSRYLKGVRLAKIMKKTSWGADKVLGTILKSSSNDVKRRAGLALQAGKIHDIPYYQSFVFPWDKTRQLFLDKANPYKRIKTDIPNSLNGIFATEYEEYMQNMILTKVDRATMANSIEGREPFLDQRIIELALSLPVSIKYQNNSLKYLLKEICHKYIPKSIMERPKQGFGIPVMDWLLGDMNYLLKEYLAPERIVKQGIFDVDRVNEYLAAYQKSNNFPNNTFVWYMLIFQMWYDRWMT